MIKTLTNLFKQDKEKFVVPKGVQDVIPIKAIYDDGIFQVGKDMPNGQIKRCFYALRPVCKTKSEYVCKMAEIFEVSKQAMEIRLKDFALI